MRRLVRRVRRVKVGEKGAKGVKWCKDNSKLGFRVPTTCNQKSLISMYSG